jgi:hypothetical protein
VGDREILETYLNSASKNTSETDILPHGTKSLLTSVINAELLQKDYYEHVHTVISELNNNIQVSKIVLQI